MVCRCLYILLRLGQICNSSTIDWISKDFAIAILSYCNFVGRQDFAFFYNPNSVLFGSGSDDRPRLTQFDQIVSGLQKIFNLDPIDVNCVYFVALCPNGWIVGAFLGQPLRPVHSLLQIPTVTIMFAWLSLQFHRLWWPRHEDAISDRN